MKHFQQTLESLKNSPKSWLITGVGGFIGSNLLEALLKLNQKVVGIDNFSTGRKNNLIEVKALLEVNQWKNFTFYEGDITLIDDCMKVTEGVDFVLHQAALGSVPRSVEDPITSNRSNIDGFLNILEASYKNNVESFTYASSSSVYGDHPALPKEESTIGNLLSPYAVTKYTNELYASVFSSCYDFKSIGLRYFNVFGNRQDPNGAYAAVIPRWIESFLSNEEVVIYGDGETSRDFCFIENVIQANILAATSDPSIKNNIYNIAFGGQTTLNELYKILFNKVKKITGDCESKLRYEHFRPGDIRHSFADISNAQNKLLYYPQHGLSEGLDILLDYELSKREGN